MCEECEKRKCLILKELKNCLLPASLEGWNLLSSGERPKEVLLQRSPGWLLKQLFWYFQVPFFTSALSLSLVIAGSSCWKPLQEDFLSFHLKKDQKTSPLYTFSRTTHFYRDGKSCKLWDVPVQCPTAVAPNWFLLFKTQFLSVSISFSPVKIF